MSCFDGGDEIVREQTRQNKIIDQQLKKDRDVYSNTHRLLLLGLYTCIQIDFQYCAHRMTMCTVLEI